jgi:flavin-dependent thymidylate synthase
MSNKVELISWHNGDRGIARAAWTSTNIDVNSKTDLQIEDLIVNKLWNNGTGKPHKTPFERGIVEFNITCEQASHIHMIKHRLANINGESARYKELKEDKFYLPEDWWEIRVTPDVKDDLEYPQEEYMDWFHALELYTELGNKLYHKALSQLTPILGRKRAKESARFFKTMNNQLTLSVMMNMSCFQNFVTLRADDAAQKEIHEIADMMVKAVKNIDGNPFKHTLRAFGL